MNIVEITIDLNNPNQKPVVEVFKVTKEIKEAYAAESNDGETGRRFSFSYFGHVSYQKPLMYSYRYKTEENDYEKIYDSEETMSAMLDLQHKLQEEIDYYQKQINGIMSYYEGARKRCGN
jgi:hypothetical protein